MVDFSYLSMPSGMNFGMGTNAPPAYPSFGTVTPQALSGWTMPSGGMPTQMPTNVPQNIPTAGMPRAGGSGFGFNMDTANLALTGLSTIGNLWAAFNAQKLAREQFNYTKGVTETNLANQIQSYNTGIEDRARSRAVVESQTPETTQAYIDRNSLRRYGS